MPWKPSRPGERPTLGYIALDFMCDLLAAPDRDEYEPFLPTREQAEFLLRLYELDPETGKRIVYRSGLSRPRGWGKSPFVSAIGIFEALGDAVPDGWDADGQPVGMPWRRIRTPIVQLIGVSEDQTENAWVPMLEMLGEYAPVHDEFPGLEVLTTRVNLPDRGWITPITSSAWTAKGGKPVCALLDQTEEYVSSNGGLRLARVLIDNATKTGGVVIETPNAFTPGMGSQAELTAKAAEEIAAGRSKMDHGFLWDHREAPGETDLEERESLVAGVRYAYGCSSDHPDGCVLHDPPCAPGWSSVDRAIARIWSPDADEGEARGNWLNQITQATDSFVSGPEWKGCIAKPPKVIADRDVITLGFDGSRGRAKGKPDATALIGCRVSDGHVFELGVWEADEVPSTWKTWAPPIVEIEAELETAFRKYRVAAFYADPGRDWRSYVNTWEGRYAGKLTVPSKREHPFEWWMTGGRATYVERAVEMFYGAVANRELSHDGTKALTRHMLNARRRESNGKLALGKASPASQLKIDAAVAAVLAWQARVDVLGKVNKTPDKRREVFAPRRIR